MRLLLHFTVNFIVIGRKTMTLQSKTDLFVSILPIWQKVLRKRHFIKICVYEVHSHFDWNWNLDLTTFLLTIRLLISIYGTANVRNVLCLFLCLMNLFTIQGAGRKNYFQNTSCALAILLEARVAGFLREFSSRIFAAIIVDDYHRSF